jgi:hypothetical protein
MQRSKRKPAVALPWPIWLVVMAGVCLAWLAQRLAEGVYWLGLQVHGGTGNCAAPANP